MIELNVRFLRRMYGTEDSDFSVFSVEAADFEGLKKVKQNKYGNFSVSGEFTISDDEIGRVFKVTLEENFSPAYPNSYKLTKLHYEFPKDPELQWKYIEDNDIFPLQIYSEIKKKFKKTDCILDIIIESPEKLKEVKGIGNSRAEVYQRRTLELKEKAILFNEYGDIEGVNSTLINKLINLKARVEDVIEFIKEDPFELIRLAGLSFIVADRFRNHYGYPLNDRNRILHGVSYYLEENFKSTGATYDDIMESSKEIARKLMVDYKELVMLLVEIKEDEVAFKKYKLKIFGKNITTHSLYESELMIYHKMNFLKNEENSQILPEEEWEKNKKEYLSTIEATLSEEQSSFLSKINDKRVNVLLGPGGAGKSWLIDITCNLLKKAKKTYGLYAPTARAAKVMSGYSGQHASTIHRGLLPDYSAKLTNKNDVLIVDEFSMVDSELSKVILSVMGTKTRLIIVGDSDQLQSVGPGNVLFDIVEYLEVPTTRLTKIFRQAEGSKILDYAQDLRDGKFKIVSNGSQTLDEGEIVFINESDDSLKQEIAMNLYKKALKETDSDYENIMLLSPVNKGPSGRTAFNRKVQELVNPQNGKGENDIVFGASLSEEKKRIFRKGDYITVTKNEYEMLTNCDKVTSIINGDLGEVVATHKNNLTFSINESDYEYTIDKSDINGMIDHAWTITIHKSQGGQADIVIIVLPENSYFMLNSNMLYTALTRAKKIVYLIGNFDEINKAAQRKANYTRKTMIQLQSIGPIED